MYEDSTREQKDSAKKSARGLRNAQSSIFKQKMAANFGKGSDEVLVKEPLSATAITKQVAHEVSPEPPSVIPNETSPVLNMMGVPDDEQIDIKVAKRPENLEILIER